MRRVLSALFVLALALPAGAVDHEYGDVVSVDATGSIIYFTPENDGTKQLYVQWVAIHSLSSSSNTCFFKLFTGDPTYPLSTSASPTPNQTVGAADTDNTPLAPGVSANTKFPEKGPGLGFKAISVICDTGQSATWHIRAGM